MDPVTIALALIIGSLTGFLSGFLGVGGGFILVPLLIFIDVPTHYAIGSSLAYIVFIGISGAVQHYRQKDCDTKAALPMIVAGIVTAQLGSYTTGYVNASLLQAILAVVLVGASIIMIVTRNRKGSELDEAASCPRNIPLATAIGLVVGFVSGLLGVGGGFILIPMLTLLLKMPIRTAVGTSLLAVAGFAASGALGHYMMDHVDPYLVVLLVLGGVVSSPLGAMATERLSPKHLGEIFVLVLLLFAIKLLIPG